MILNDMHQYSSNIKYMIQNDMHQYNSNIIGMIRNTKQMKELKNKNKLTNYIYDYINVYYIYHSINYLIIFFLLNINV